LGYHIPPVTGIGFSPDLLARLLEAFPDKFAGIKDSSGDAEYARLLGERFGSNLFVLTGNDRLFSHALTQHAAGCITAMANLSSPLLRRVWDEFQDGRTAPETQDRLTHGRGILDQYPPMPPLIKALLAQEYAFPKWTVRPPLLPFSEPVVQSAAAAFSSMIE
jgi:4-hydroxy-tetrahydrodipicolinate synthase